MLCCGSSAADLGVDINERADKLLELAKFGDFALHFLPSGGSG
jgi:hypothetical protein